MNTALFQREAKPLESGYSGLIFQKNLKSPRTNPADPLLRQRRCKELNHLLPTGSIQRIFMKTFYFSVFHFPFFSFIFTTGSLPLEPLKLPI